MALVSTATQLAEVQAALTAVRKMQSYKLGDRTVTYADYEWLMRDEERLSARLAREDGSTPAVSYADLSGSF